MTPPPVAGPSPSGPSASVPPSPGRRVDLDALRVLAVAFGLLYHSTRPFDFEAWHVKSAALSPLLQTLGDVLTMWRLPLLFLVSGAGTFYALGRRPSGRFAAERVRRLLVPLAFGMLVVVPPQIYVERLAAGTPGRLVTRDFAGSYADFLTHRDFAPYPAGDLSWHHLWFLAYLLVFSLALLPVLRVLRRRWAGGARPPRVGALVGAFAALLIGDILLRDAFPTVQDFVHDWANNVHYALLFVLGFAYAARPGLRDLVRRALPWSLAALALAFPARLAVMTGVLVLPDDVLGYVGRQALRDVNEVAGLLAILALAARAFVRETPLLAWARPLVLPFYVWHQTVIVVLGFFVVRLPGGAALQFPLLLALSFAVTVGLSVLSARVAWLRPLFGVPGPRPSAARHNEADVPRAA